MNIKQNILSELENNRGAYLSGGELSERLGVSRTAVWKAIRSLTGQGYSIDAVTNKGYCLLAGNDIISPQGIQKYLDPRKDPFSFHIFKNVPSTNLTAKELAVRGEPEGTVVISEEQSAGKGRLGRSFYSPGGTGLYMSILLRPAIGAGEASLITAAAAAAVSRAIDELTPDFMPASERQPAQIKWVNDIYLGGRKVCGILTEASLDLEGGGLEYAVLGIGINIRPPQDGFPDELREIAGSCVQAGEPDRSSLTSDLRCRLAASVLKHFFGYYETLERRPFLEEYKKRSFVTGKDILIRSGSGSVKAHALEIDDNCRLVVRLEDGSVKRLSSGEISLRLLEAD